MSKFNQTHFLLMALVILACLSFYWLNPFPNNLQYTDAQEVTEIQGKYYIKHGDTKEVFIHRNIVEIKTKDDSKFYFKIDDDSDLKTKIIELTAKDAIIKFEDGMNPNFLIVFSIIMNFLPTLTLIGIFIVLIRILFVLKVKRD